MIKKAENSQVHSLGQMRRRKAGKISPSTKQIKKYSSNAISLKQFLFAIAHPLLMILSLSLQCLNLPTVKDIYVVMKHNHVINKIEFSIYNFSKLIYLKSF